MAVAAGIALAAALVLSVEKIHLLENPDALLSCSINGVLNCSTVMQSWQSAVFFGIPNMFIGLIAFSVLLTVAVVALWGGARYAKAFVRAMVIGVGLGTVFAYWLFFSSLYVIQVLCPWCLVVTVACTLIFASVVHSSLRDNVWNVSNKANQAIQTFLKAGYHQLVVVGWLALMVALVFLQFGAALFT